jgi:hypothetical protein
MASLYITEFARTGVDLNGRNGRTIAEQVPLAEQKIAIGAGSVQSSAFNAKTRLIRLHADAICSVAFGVNPAASATNERMTAGQTEYFTVDGSAPVQKVATITNT